MRKSITLIGIILVTLLTSTIAMADTAAATESSSKPVININTADASQFALLPRVGPKAAERIVEYRKSNGAFKKTTDLMQVKGIGDKSFELLSPYLTVDGKTTLTSKQHGPKRAAKSRPSASPKAQ